MGKITDTAATDWRRCPFLFFRFSSRPISYFSHRCAPQPILLTQLAEKPLRRSERCQWCRTPHNNYGHGAFRQPQHLRPGVLEPNSSDVWLSIEDRWLIVTSLPLISPWPGAGTREAYCPGLWEWYTINPWSSLLPESPTGFWKCLQCVSYPKNLQGAQLHKQIL